MWLKWTFYIRYLAIILARTENKAMQGTAFKQRNIEVLRLIKFKPNTVLEQTVSWYLYYFLKQC